MMLFWAALAAAIGTSMIGQTLLKFGAGEPDFLSQLLDWRTLIGLVLYGLAAMLYIIALRRIPMSVALPCTAISYVAATLIGHYAFHEPITIGHVVAIGLITSGVLVLAFT
jgi:multidrug transporter EmrE-like cation transporter